MAWLVSRRGMAATCLSAAYVAASRAAAPYDPRKTAEGQIKLTATLDGSPAWWIYTGRIYAVRPQARPVAVLAIAGCESHWPQRHDDGSFTVTGITASFFRDPASGVFIDRFANPFTGRTVAVQPNILAGGGALYPADGGSARAFGHIRDAAVAPGGFARADPDRPLGAVVWDVLGDSVMLATDRAWNVPVEPQIEAQTQIADRAGFFTPGVARLPARYSATTIVPWMNWMGMGDLPSHLVWHTAGEKVFAIDRVPASYRIRAGELMDRLASRPPP